MLGTVVDACYRGYDCILVQDATATTSPDGGLSNFIYNASNVRCAHLSQEWVLADVLEGLWFRYGHNEVAGNETIEVPWHVDIVWIIRTT